MRTTIVVALFFLMYSCAKQTATKSSPTDITNVMIRIAEIEVDSSHLAAYLDILKEEAAASVRLEPGVICIYPMFEREQPTRIRLLEIYADRAAYDAHLKTPHFLHYKTTTLNMVKSLELIDMKAIDPNSMASIFAKLSR